MTAPSTPPEPRPARGSADADFTDAELDAMAELTPEKIARAREAAPRTIRPYLDAAPSDDGDR